MIRYAVLLRGINLGRNQRVAMVDLRDLLAGIGLTDIRTHLQSGNAVVSSASNEVEAVTHEIEHHIEAKLGLVVRCLLRTSEELHGVMEGNPLTAVANDGSRMMALFLSAAPAPTLLAAHAPTALAPQQIHVGDRVIYQWCPDGVLAAPAVSGFVEKYLKVAVTARNWNTVTRLSALLDDC